LYNPTTWSTNGLTPITIQNPPGLPYYSFNVSADGQSLLLFTTDPPFHPWPYPFYQTIWTLNTNGFCWPLVEMYNTNEFYNNGNGMLFPSYGSACYVSNDYTKLYVVQNWIGTNGTGQTNINYNQIMAWSLLPNNRLTSINQTPYQYISNPTFDTNATVGPIQTLSVANISGGGYFLLSPTGPTNLTLSIQGATDFVISDYYGRVFIPYGLTSSQLMLNSTYGIGINANNGVTANLGSYNGLFGIQANGQYLFTEYANGTGSFRNSAGVQQWSWDASGNITANSFIGNGLGLIGLTPGQVGAQPTNSNLTKLVTNDGSGLTNLQSANLIGSLPANVISTALLQWQALGGTNAMGNTNWPLGGSLVFNQSTHTLSDNTNVLNANQIGWGQIPTNQLISSNAASTDGQGYAITNHLGVVTLTPIPPAGGGDGSGWTNVIAASYSNSVSGNYSTTNFHAGTNLYSYTWIGKIVPTGGYVQVPIFTNIYTTPRTFTVLEVVSGYCKTNLTDASRVQISASYDCTNTASGCGATACAIPYPDSYVNGGATIDLNFSCYPGANGIGIGFYIVSTNTMWFVAEITVIQP
jgi:hypothetical protein